LSKFYLGIDQSQRCSGFVLLNSKGELHASKIVASTLSGLEEMLIFQFSELCSFIDTYVDSDEDEVFGLIEGLAMRGAGNYLTFAAALQAYYRTRFLTLYGNHLGTVPVTMWRSKVLTKEEQREAKAAGTDGLKWAVFNKLPATTRKQYADYVEEMKDEINMAKDSKLKPGSKSKKYVDALQDLADAYFIAKFCFNLSTTK